MTFASARKELKEHSQKQKAKVYQSFFKTGPGEYGAGDRFIGVTVPDTRKIAHLYQGLTQSDTIRLLKSRIHEERLLALFILVIKFDRGVDADQERIYNLYLKNIKHINNWDLVDLSADRIVGAYLEKKNKDVLLKFAKSKNLWKRRIAIIATFHFIKCNQFEVTCQIAEILLHDKEDLIHKAVGWMLREVGKRDQFREEQFLTKYYKSMPRTMLRYAIERFNEPKRQAYLKNKI